MSALWKIRLLGGLAAERQDRAVTRFPTQKCAALLGYLAFYPDRPHARERLVYQLWPNADPEDGRNNLRVALSTLRRLLEPPGSDSHSLFTVDRLFIGLDPTAILTDVAEFNACLQSARSAPGDTERIQCLARAVELYRGELLPGHYEEWIPPEQARLGESHLRALGQLVLQLERLGELDAALEYALRAVAADPMREEAHRDLIRLYAALGQPATARRRYKELQRILLEEFGTDPSAATVALLTQLDRPPLMSPAAAPAASDAEQPVSAPPPMVAAPDLDGRYRLATILCLALPEAGAELLAEQQSDWTAAALAHMQQAVMRYDGQVARVLEAGVLAVFGAPVAHEDDAERAVLAALETDAAAAALGMRVRAGVESGEVYVAPGVGPGCALNVIGPAAKAAAQLCEAAQPGQILAGEVACGQARGAFDFSDPLPTLDAGCLGARPVIGMRACPRKPRGLEGLRAELIDRDRELAVLQAALKSSISGCGQVVFLTGEAGIGKSRLAEELRGSMGVWVCGCVGEEPDTHTPTHPHTHTPTPLYLEGRCMERSMSAAYALFVDLFHALFARRAEEPVGGARLHTVLQQWVAQGVLSADQIEEIGPWLGHLLSIRYGDARDRRLDSDIAEEMRHQTFTAVRDLLVALAKRQPLVLVLEDLHWADALSLDTISVLLDTLPDARILLLCLFRPGENLPCARLGTLARHKCPGSYHEVPLRELTPANSQSLVASLLGMPDLPDALQGAVVDRARGNPFYLEEVVRSLIEAGTVYRQGTGWHVGTVCQATAVPPGVQSVILSRVDRLEAVHRRVLEAASVLGRVFRTGVLDAVLADDGSVALSSSWRSRSLQALEERQLVYRARVVPEEEYSFQHVLVQETVYSTLSQRRRAELHRRAGQAIESLDTHVLEARYEHLAYHYERSRADEKAVEYLLKAGGKAQKAYLNEDAARYFQRALERLEAPGLLDARPEWRLDALMGLGLVQWARAELDEAETCLRSAIALGKQLALPPGDLARLYGHLGWVLNNTGVRWQDMVDVGEEALALLANTGSMAGRNRRAIGRDENENPIVESAELAIINTILAWGYKHLGTLDRWREITLQNARFLQSLPYSWDLATPYVCVYLHYFEEKQPEEAETWLDALARHAEEHRHLKALSKVYLGRGSTSFHRGGLRAAIPDVLRGLELATRIGDVAVADWCAMYLVHVHYRLGEMDQSRAYCARWDAILGATGAKHRLAEVQSALGAADLAQGATEAALEHLRLAVELARGSGAASPQVLLRLGHACLAAERWQEAQAQFTDAIASRTLMCVTMKHRSWTLASALAGLERCYAEQGSEGPAGFRACALRLKQANPDADFGFLTHWFLEPGEVHPFPNLLLRDSFRSSEPSVMQRDSQLSNCWRWCDPLGDCSFRMDQGLEIRAASGRGLWWLNLSAPRLVRPVSGDFAVQTVCSSGTRERPAIGGLLIWQDHKNYLHVTRGLGGRHDVSFQGCLRNEDGIIGRGGLPCERAWLRLERVRGCVKALCSGDGQQWFALGQIELPGAEGVEVGLHAIGLFDFTIDSSRCASAYAGAFPDGTAIRFESFELWGR